MHLKRVRDPPHTPHGCVPQAALSLGNECSQEGEGSLPKPAFSKEANEGRGEGRVLSFAAQA